MMSKIVFSLAAIVAILALAMAGCSSTSATTTTTPSTSSPQTSTAPLSTTAITTTAQPTPQGIIKIGHIRPLTGNLAMSSNLMVQAFDFAFQQIGYQVAGKQIQIVVGDSKGDSATALDVARKMVENDKVALLVGPTQAGEGPAVAGYINQVGIPEIFTSPQPAEIFAGANKWAFASGGTNPQYATSMGIYAYEQAGYRKVDVLTQDTAAGHIFINAFMDGFKSKGGQIVQETYTQYPTPDFASYLTVLKDADAVVAWTAGADAVKFLIQYHEMGIDKRLPLVGAFHGSFLANSVLKALPPADGDATVGDLVPTPYSPFLDTPFNKQFVADIQAKFGILPDDTQSGPYQGAMAIIQALKATNGDTTPEKLRQALLSVKFDGPEGPVKFDSTGVSIKTVYICKVNKSGSDFSWQPIFSYKDVPAAGR
jgi:branched-chain amino acid transport system substrate-binding protein